MSASEVERLLGYVPVLVRGRPLRGSERYRPLFIVGSGRCGMTLMRAILESHPDIHIPPETFVLGDVVRDYRRYSRLPWHVVLGIVLAKFEFHPLWHVSEWALGPLFSELDRRPLRDRNLATVLDGVYRAHLQRHKPSATRWGDKTPRNTFALRELHTVFPDLQVVHMVRDGRDVVESLGRLAELDLSLFARHWIRSVRVAQEFGAGHRAQYLEVRYEDLALRPAQAIERVASFLDLPFEERMLRHHELDLPLGDVDRHPHLRGARQAIHHAAIGRWRTAFDPTQVAELSSAC